MSLQYITDGNGQTTGVFIPIKECNELKAKFAGIEEAIDVPDWQIQLVKERLEEYRKTNERQGFNDAIDKIEKDLDA